MTMELFSAKVCPYAHRTRLVLAEKNVDFTLSEIAFDAKPERFLAVSPYGKVPALVHDGLDIYESAIINEYLEEVFAEPALMPADPGLRAKMRIWIDYLDDHYLDDHYAIIRSSDPARVPELRVALMDRLRFIETQGLARLSGDGPYWLGAEATLLDFAYYPFFERMPVWEHYRGVSVPAECERLQRWRETMAARPSVQAIATEASYYIEHYKGYAKERMAA